MPFPHLFLIPDTDLVWKAGSYTQDLSGILGLQLGNNLLNNESQIAKRTIDLAFSVILTLFLLPLIAIISVLVILDSGFPVFYSQKTIRSRRPNFSDLEIQNHGQQLRANS